MTVINCVTPKAENKHELLFNKLAFKGSVLNMHLYLTYKYSVTKIPHGNTALVTLMLNKLPYIFMSPVKIS
jgi:hypothetical protein